VVNTMPHKTLEAVYDHAQTTGADTVHGTYEASRAVLDDVVRVGVPYEKILADLETAGVDSFAKSWAELLQTVTEGLQAAAEKG